jgi:hypothetical protein
VDEYWSRYRSLVDEQIQQAQERGDFDNLPGKGKPLSNLHGPDDELWWVREYVRREGLPREALLPTSLRLRKERERLGDRLSTLTSEKDVREVIAELNRTIVAWMRAPSEPVVPLGPVNVEDAVRRWRESRAPALDPAQPVAVTPVPATCRRWWHRLRRRSIR